MHILGISLGSPNGNSEILLKAALLSAMTSSPETATSIIRLTQLSIPSTPLPGHLDHPLNISSEATIPKTTSTPDDRSALLNSILDADALIIASPIYTRQPPGLFKLFCDTALGPFVDAAFVKTAISQKAAGNPRFKDFTPDERVLKPRVVGLIAVGGARSSEWTSLALPSLQQSVFSLQAKVVDQIVIHGCPFPGSVLLPETGAIEKAELVGHNVASQLGRSYEEAEFLGEDGGSCPYCHLNVVVFKNVGNEVECAVCGAQGTLTIGEDGVIVPVFEEDSETSVLTWKGKHRHMEEIGVVGKALGPKMPGLKEQKEQWAMVTFASPKFSS